MRIYRNRRTVFGFLILRKSGRASHIPRLNVLSGNYILASGDEAVDYYAGLPSFTDDGYVIRQFGSQTMILGKTEDGLDRAVRYYLNSFINGESDYYVSGEGYKVKSLSIGGRTGYFRLFHKNRRNRRSVQPLCRKRALRLYRQSLRLLSEHRYL